MNTGASAIVGFLCLTLVGCLPSFLTKYRPEAVTEPVISSSPFNTKKVGPNHFVISRPTSLVWSSVIDVLLNNYNINIINKESGVLTTEWDAFYLNEKLFRNKITVGIRKEGALKTSIKLVNNVELLGEGPGGRVWFPSDKGTEESDRIIKEIKRTLKNKR